MALKRKPLPTRVVTGFLGAGKTTFVLEQLKKSGSRVAVLVNEFGELGIDGTLVRVKGGVEVVEMPGGCICCSQKEGLLQSIRRIAAQLAPELLLIEPSGVAESSELLHLLDELSREGVIHLDAVVTVIDAETFLEFSEPDAFGLFFLDQVRCAELILVNKSDLVSREELDLIELRIAELNPGALPVRTEFCRADNGIFRGSGGRNELPHREPLRLDSVSLVPGPLSEAELSLLLDQLEAGKFGRIVRGKGFLEVAGRGWVNLQVVSGRSELEPMAVELDPRLTLIGFDLRGETLRDFLPERGAA